MSVFSLIKRSRQAAKEETAKKAEKEKAEAKVPYKHVPKHAAVDALLGGPTGWKEADRVRIMEENRRRSAMTANGMGMPSGLSTPVHAGVFTRANSSLTHVSYSTPSGYATPVPHIPRAYSYHGPTPGWSHHGGEISYLSIDMAGAASSGTSLKGKEKEVRRPRLDSGRTSRSSSRFSATGGRFPYEGASRTRDGSSSPVQSSSNSSSSEDDLEIKPAKQLHTSAVTTSSPLAGSSSRPGSDSDSVHRLHPGHARNMSNSSYKPRSSSPRQSPSRSSPTRAGGSSSSSASLSAAGIPPVPAIPPMQFGGNLTIPTSSNSSSSNNNRSSHPIPPPVVVEEDVSDLSEDSTATGTSTPPIGTAVSAPTARKASPRSSPKTTQFAELEPIQSNVVSNTNNQIIDNTPYKKYFNQKERPAVAITSLPTSFDEAALATPAQQLATTIPQQQGKLGKRPKSTTPKEEKVPKKSRWSFMSSRRTAVAV
ncbi:hypothetical protein B0T20DRAFT_452962 [Sordaria brevicollis]|uniref:Uncharacterized protein n=1 Tax=Sordaria brevicollis TaxID=83679 RepID=A0AAE0UBM3_SORBR|nr:hypothetical protein B0T20DRAFT_452962 [Sordaria brevicollis]